MKTAYLAYWKMIDRLAAAPDPNDPELQALTIDPRLSDARDAFATAAARGETTVTPPNARYAHAILNISVRDSRATITDCTVDDQVVLDSAGNPIDNAVTTKHYEVAMTLVADRWKVSELHVMRHEDGVQSCDA